MADQVRAWAEKIVIPTYRIGKPDKNPMFLEKRVYQGSSGVVYPHPVIDQIFDQKEDRQYTAVFLENRYLKIMVLPEIGGRVQMALDKTNGYHFVYYNRVIKPALVGLAGPWISGGIEFNWPQHHRPSTFDSLDWRIVQNPDGSQTVWCGEIERMFRTKGMHGMTLYPGRAYLEIRVKLYNRTNEPQTFLWWANPAVHVHQDYQSVFPPDVHAVMDHGKRDVSAFPIATGVYYKVNYYPGTDISRYANIPVPTSYMAYHSDYDFIGDYDHRARAGMMHVANHHVVPGKKQWTWGCGDFGQSWDRQLTDEDGPYIELMCGAYTDNQPDFSWLQPGEEKSFTQTFMPYKLIGPAKNATHEAVINLEVDAGKAHLGVYLSSPRTVRVRLAYQGATHYERTIQLSPESALLEDLDLPQGAQAHDLTLTVFERSHELISYTPRGDDTPDIPAPDKPAPPPQEIATNEELYLQGQHLEQYRHATFAPEPYYQEALRRDPLDSRCNNALGLLLYRRGKFADAERHFRAAIQRLTRRNPNPYDGEPFYNLGLAIKMQGRNDEAYAAFHKSVWNAAWQSAGYFQLARCSSRTMRYPEALDQLERALSFSRHHRQARHLKVALLRRKGDMELAKRTAADSLEHDPLEYACLWELHLTGEDSRFWELTRGAASTCTEVALDYAHAGLWEEAVDLLDQVPERDPMVAYTKGWVLLQAGEREQAAMAFKQAAAVPPHYCFPNRLEDVVILQSAMEMQPDDPRAPYYLGNFWYAHRCYDDAIDCWQKARELDAGFPTVHRNLGLAYYNKRSDPDKAQKSLERALSLDPHDARLLFELDQLYKKLNRSPVERQHHLQKYPQLIEQRDDLTLEWITLHNLLGQPDKAYQLLMARNFHPWEGGEGKVTGQYVISLVEIARRLIQAEQFALAIDRLQAARQYPSNLGEGKLYGAQENNIYYYLGCAYEGFEDYDQARKHFLDASTGLSEPSSAMYYYDQPPEMIFYQGLARQKLGLSDDAAVVFNKLLDYGRTHLEDLVNMDYFAVSLPDFLVFDDDLTRRNRLHCHYMQALGYLGLGEQPQARAQFEQVLRLDANHLGAVIHQKLLDDD